MEYTYMVDKYGSEGYQLRESSDKVNQTTSYIYTAGNATVRYFPAVWDLTPASLTYLNLTGITHPTGARNVYSYQSKTADFSDGVASGFFALKSREDRLSASDATPRCKEEYDFTVTTYTENPGKREKKRYYTSKATISGPGNRFAVHLFNKKHLRTSEEIRVGSSVGTKISSTDFAYNGDDLLTNETFKRFSAKNQQLFVQKSVVHAYDEGSSTKRANLTSITETYSDDPQNNKTTTMGYDPNFSILISKSYKQDANTSITEAYDLRAESDGKPKVVERSKILVNSVVKAQTEFLYNAAFQVTEERLYHWNSGAAVPYHSVSYTYGPYSPQPTKKEIAGVKDADGNIATFPGANGAGIFRELMEYDWYGRLMRQTDANKGVAAYVYDGIGRVTKETYPDNAYKEIQYVVTAGMNRVIETEKDSNGTVLRGRRTEFTTLGMTERVYALSPDTCLSYCTYDSLNRLSYEYTYGTEGTTTAAYTYDALDRITAKTTSGPNMTAHEEAYGYDEAFQGKYYLESKEISGGTAAPTISSYILKDMLGRVFKETVGDSGGLATTGISSTVYKYDLLDNKTSLTDPNNNVTTWKYDHAGRIKSETRQTKTGAVTADTEYDALGYKKVFIDFRRKQAQYSYDALGRLLEQKSDFSGSIKAVARYTYDAVGNIISLKVLSAGSIYNETKYTYDSRNRVIDTILNDGKTETRSRCEYDAAGNKTATYTGMLGASTSGAQKITCTYDRFGNMKSMTDPIGNSPNPSDPARRTETYTYDNYGQLRSKKDRNGFVTTCSYDGLGRVRRETVVDSGGDVPDNYRAFAYHKNGLKATEENGELSVSFTYDKFGRLVTQSESCRQGAANAVVKVYGYDACGNRTSFTMSKDGAQQISLSYTYDKNRLEEVWRGGVKIAEYTYDANGNRDSLNYPQSGLSVNYAYNDANHITDLYNKKSGAHRSSYHYSYFPDGNQSRKVGKVAGQAEKTTDYLYDRLGRLTEEKEQGGDRVVYEYDRFSNRRHMIVTDVNNKATTTNYEYDLRNRLETETKTYDGTEEIFHYRYDFNGNQTYREWEKFSPKKEPKTPGRIGFYSDKFKQNEVILEMREYNGFGELTYVYRDTLETRYIYRPDGLRHKKLYADNSSHTHIWDGQNIVAEYVANGNVVARYLRGINLIARDQDNLLQYCLHNVHGDVVQRTDQNGTTLKNYEYDAFGVEKNPEILDANPFRYCCEYYDREVETYYLRARHYDPRTSRMLSEDVVQYTEKKLPNDQSVIDPLSLNRYNYCYNNPIRYSDSSGNIAVEAAISAGLVAIGIIGTAVTAYILAEQIAGLANSSELDLSKIRVPSIGDLLMSTGIAASLEIALMTHWRKEIQVRAAELEKLRDSKETAYQLAFVSPFGELIRFPHDLNAKEAGLILTSGQIVNSEIGLLDAVARMYNYDTTDKSPGELDAFWKSIHWGIYTHDQKDAFAMGAILGFDVYRDAPSPGRFAHDHGAGQYPHYNSLIPSGTSIHIWYGGKIPS